jgi:large subunit ribosomal protein L23
MELKNVTKLTIYNIVKGPIISEKAYMLNKKHNQLVLEVHTDATRPMIKQAIEKLFNVKVKTVRTLISKYTPGSGMKRRKVGTPKIKKQKKAFITLAEGYSLELFEQGGSSTPTVVKEEASNS